MMRDSAWRPPGPIELDVHQKTEYNASNLQQQRTELTQAHLLSILPSSTSHVFTCRYHPSKHQGCFYSSIPRLKKSMCGLPSIERIFILGFVVGSVSWLLQVNLEYMMESNQWLFVRGVRICISPGTCVLGKVALVKFLSFAITREH
jgi:hypothetical protein